MKTLLTLFAFVSAVTAPVSLLAELGGIAVPPSLDPMHAFASFATAFILLGFVRDYSPRPRVLARVLSLQENADHPLAA